MPTKEILLEVLYAENKKLLKQIELLKNENSELNRVNAELDELIEHYCPDKQMR